MYSISKITLTQDSVQEVIRHHFGSQRKIAVFTELVEGLYAAAARIELDDGFACVLKAAPPASRTVLRYEKDIMRAEVESMRLVRARTDLPVAEILAYDTSRSLLPSEYFLMKVLPGTPLHKIRQEIPAEPQTLINRELGRMTRELSQITNDCFGYWSQPQPPGTGWRATYQKMVDGVLADGVDIGASLPLPYDEVLRLIQPHLPALDEVTTPRLVHWDLWDGNIFVDPQSYAITGLIDFERALWADPLMEVVFADRDPHSHAAQGFGGGVLSTPTEQQRRMLYSMYLWLIMLIEIPYRQYDNDWQLNFTTTRFNEEVVNLRTFPR